MWQRRRRLGFLALLGCLVGLKISALVVDTPAARSLSPDFSATADSDERNRSFFAFIGKELDLINLEIAADRELIESMRRQEAAGNQLDLHALRHLERIVKHYGLSGLDPREDSDWSFLLLHVDQLPPSLVLVQAAYESEWGTSSPAREANNFFGQLCFEPGCGLEPVDRGEGLISEIRRFSNVRDSVEAYTHEMNTDETYFEFRLLRARMRSEGTSLLGSTLAGGLANYSVRGQGYVENLRSMIRMNRLEPLRETEFSRASLLSE